jgi:hypothetical protein
MSSVVQGYSQRRLFYQKSVVTRGVFRPQPTSCSKGYMARCADHLTTRKKAQSETLWCCLAIIPADCITRLGLPFIETYFRNYTRAQSDHKAFPAKMVLASGGRCWSVATSRWFGAHQTKLRLHLGIWPVWPVWPVLFWLFYREILLYNTHTVYCIYRVGNLRRPRRTSGPYVQNDLSLVITQSAPRKGQKTTNGPWLVRPRTMSICIFLIGQNGITCFPKKKLILILGSPRRARPTTLPYPYDAPMAFRILC